MGQIRHLALSKAEFAAALYVALNIIWYSAVTAVRCSLLLFYIQVFSVRHFRNVCWVVLALNLASMIAVILSTALICHPVAYQFNRTIPGGHCGNLSTFQRFMAVWNLLADATMVALPMPVLWKLQMQARKKLELSIVFGMGIVRYLRFKSSGSRQGQSMSGRDLNSGSQMKSRMGKQKNAFTELGDADTDVELLDQTCQDIGYEGSYKVSAGSLGSSKEADEEHIVAMPSLLVQQGWNNKAAGIQVRKDFSVNSVTRE
ncbi:MAG: hypothetical protein Q9201_000014 [Fulgogasparrea decipioides]